MSTDFFDEDLLKDNKAPADDEQEGAGVAGRPSMDLDLGRLARHKRELTGQVAGAVKEIEELRRRQEELERQKQALETLTQKQERYEAAKREIIETLDRGMILLEKDELQATRMAELLASMRAQYKEALQELRAISEDTWSEPEFEGELNRALTLVEEAQLLHRKSAAKLEGANWQRGAAGKGAPSMAAEAAPLHSRRRFVDWVVIGLAVSLPLIVALVAVFLAYLFLFGFV
jgi:hypothetical protein